MLRVARPSQISAATPKLRKDGCPLGTRLLGFLSIRTCLYRRKLADRQSRKLCGYDGHITARLTRKGRQTFLMQIKIGFKHNSRELSIQTEKGRTRSLTSCSSSWVARTIPSWWRVPRVPVTCWYATKWRTWSSVRKTSTPSALSKTNFRVRLPSRSAFDS